MKILLSILAFLIMSPCSADILTVYPDAGTGNTTVDGYASRTGVDETWSTIRGGAGTASADTDASAPMIYISSSTTNNQWDRITRAGYTWDTSALTASAVISATTVSIYGWFVSDGLSITPDVNIYSFNPASDNAIVNADYSQTGTTAYSDSVITYGAWADEAYNDFTLNSTGIAAVSLSGITKMSAVNANYDVADTPPSWSSSANSYIYSYYADETGTTKDPKLVVTYTMADGAGNFFHLFD